MPPGLELTAAVYACWRAGAAIVVADAGLGLAPDGRGVAQRRPGPPDRHAGSSRCRRRAADTGGRIVIGDRPKPVRRLLGASMTRSAARKSVRDRRLPVPRTRARLQRTRSHRPPTPRRRCCSPPARPARPRELSTATPSSRPSSSWSGPSGLTPDDRLVAAFAPFALYGPALGHRRRGARRWT